MTTLTAAALAAREKLTEKAFMAQVAELARLCGWKVFHPFDSRKSAAGWPDLTMVRDRIIYAELKAERGRVTPEQLAWHAALVKAGGEAYVWRPADWPTIERVLREVR